MTRHEAKHHKENALRGHLEGLDFDFFRVVVVVISYDVYVVYMKIIVSARFHQRY